MNEFDTVVENLKLLMSRTGIDSQNALSRVSGVSQTQIGNILRHEQQPGMTVLAKLAAAFGVESWQLLAPSRWLGRLNASQVAELLDLYAAAEVRSKLQSAPPLTIDGERVRIRGSRGAFGGEH